MLLIVFNLYFLLTGEIRAAVRLMKKMGNRGIKRTISSDRSLSAFMAEPLIRWTPVSMIILDGLRNHQNSIVCKLTFYFPIFVFFTQSNEAVANDDLIDTYIKMHPNMDPHIVCVAEELQNGLYYIIVQGTVLKCGEQTFSSALEIFFKLASIIAIEMPTLLRKLFELVQLHEFKIISSSKKSSVNLIHQILQESLEN